MSQSLEFLPRSVTAADVPADWIARVNYALQADGVAYRASASAPHTIEAQSQYDPSVWMPIMLHNNGTAFETVADRDVILNLLWRPLKLTQCHHKERDVDGCCKECGQGL